MLDSQTVDITPSPRILRVLGEIPFHIWQCFAELMDNSIDALLKQGDNNDSQNAVWVSWSGTAVAAKDRTIEITDNAEGMSLEQIRNAVRAGYSNNSPIGNLGLFGMGFNIATARLGNKTQIWSTTKADSTWSGIEIDFDELAKGEEFKAPMLERAKAPGEISGTQIIISELKPGTATSVVQQERDIRRTLENIYAPLLMEHNIDLYINGKVLHPKKPCIWDESRYVLYKNQRVPAVIKIDKQLGTALFDLDRNAYLTLDEQEDYQGLTDDELPSNICYRERHLYGWLGIQRYSDPNDFGIDFIRNGRKILVRDKQLFSYTSPVTGEATLQYPVELGSTVGGRIVGQLHVDYLLPTYQKNGFDYDDSTWYETVAAICGEGPFLPRQRKALGLEETPSSPLGILVNAYRRTDAGTKCLAIKKNTAKEFLAEFLRGNQAYLSDDKWWAAAVEYDQAAQQGINPPASVGTTPSDDIEDMFSGGPATQTSPLHPSATSCKPNSTNPKATDRTPATSKPEDIRQKSMVVESLTKKYRLFSEGGANNPVDVKVYELKSGELVKNDSRVPFLFFPKGFECEFFYDPRHQLIQQYPVMPVEYLLMYLAEHLKRRDQLEDLGLAYCNLVEHYLKDERIDAGYLKERAENFFNDIRGPIKELLSPISTEVVECVHEAQGDFEDAMTLAMSNGESFSELKSSGPKAYDILDYVPSRTLLRIIERFPDYLFDKKLFDVSYCEIDLDDAQMRNRLRESSKERIVSYVKDLLYLTSTPSAQISKNDLNRVALSLDSLTSKLVSYEFSN